MRTVKDVEAYLERLRRPYGGVDGVEHTFVIRSNGVLPAIAVRVDPPLVIFRVDIGKVEGGEELSLYEQLLRLNAKELVHASYGLDEDHVVLSAALELENLDFNEVEATVDELEVALAQQVPSLAKFSRRTSQAPKTT